LIEFQFSGTVTYSSSNSLASVGSPIVGAFSYDADTAPNSAPVPGYTNYQLTPGFSAQVNGHTIATNRLSVTVYHNFGGDVADMVWLTGSRPVVDGGTSYPNGAFGFVVASRGGTQVLSSDALPASFDVNAYDGGPGYNYGFLQADGGPTGQLLQFSVDSVTSTAVPIPAAVWLFGSALGVMGWVSRKATA
jgi:hypothetical protein